MTGNDRIKLEDLLRLKRAERPSEADWERFDKELKNKLYFQIVRKPSAAERIFSGRAVKFGAVFSAAGAALAVAFFAPSYIGASTVALDSSNVSARSLSASSTPLPSVDASYAVNELPGAFAGRETPVAAKMSGASDSESTRYVSNVMGSTGTFVF